jgi:hypothetical protein
MWTCPCRGRAFANANQSRTCARLGDLARHFEGTDPVVRAMFDRLVGELGPLVV